ncbi:GHKL domain-containing protein [Clostridium sp. LQ25]|uniref:GHKL domain-containing protein n=1 Tax=Clostridium sp. LQ25 TaxID=2992805 RepID=UPI0022519688|nr:GHKL domain-containing protein [Clostridium sp. LQ25]UZT06167.1 GHKL domain-containing protein [Clostridium sp. LQ25]
MSKETNINSEDLGTILGNLLDNAIEACYFVEDGERKIDLNIYNRNNSIIISIINTKKHEESLEKTWKSDKLNHGIGLKSVKKLVDKYNGAMNDEDKGEIYEVNIILWT